MKAGWVGLQEIMTPNEDGSGIKMSLRGVGVAGTSCR